MPALTFHDRSAQPSCLCPHVQLSQPRGSCTAGRRCEKKHKNRAHIWNLFPAANPVWGHRAHCLGYGAALCCDSTTELWSPPKNLGRCSKFIGFICFNQLSSCGFKKTLLQLTNITMFHILFFMCSILGLFLNNKIILSINYWHKQLQNSGVYLRREILQCVRGFK